MKRIFTPSNIITLVILGFALFSQAPTIANNLRTEGSALGELKTKIISVKDGDKTTNFPPKGKAMAIFWSTTCGPCKIEMARLRSSVKDGKIPQESLYAINPFESVKEIRRFLKENNFPFTFIDAPQVGLALNIRATPTTIFMEDGKITSMKSGMSFMGIWQAENFFK